MESEAHKRRHKHRGGKKFTLSGELKARLLKLDRAGLEVLRNFNNGKDKSLPFKFFEEAFPITCQDIVLKEVIIFQLSRLSLSCCLSWVRMQVNCSTIKFAFYHGNLKICLHLRLVWICVINMACSSSSMSSRTTTTHPAGRGQGATCGTNPTQK